MASYATKRFVDVIAAIPLTAIDAGEKILSTCCYFVLAMFPIQMVALSFYASQPALAYCVFYQLFHNTHGLLQMYTGEDTSPLTQEEQYLATLVSLPLGLATAFTVLNLTSGEILKGTDKIYNSGNNKDTTPRGLTFSSRVSGAATYGKDSFKAIFNNMIAQFKGENKLGKQ